MSDISKKKQCLFAVWEGAHQRQGDLHNLEFVGPCNRYVDPTPKVSDNQLLAALFGEPSDG